MSTPLLKRLAPRHSAVFRALQLGDMLCSVPALRALRATCPQACITLVGLPWAHAFAARFPHYVDDFLPFPGFPGLPERAPDLQAIPGFIAEAQACRFDLALQLHGDGRLSNAVVGLFGAAQCAGFGESGEADAFLPYPDRGSEIERLLALTTHLGAPSPYSRLEFPLRDEDHAELAASGLADGIEAGGYLCLHAGARDVARRWPAECFAALGDWLHEATGLPLVLTGSADEQPLTARVRAGMKAPAIGHSVQAQALHVGSQPQALLQVEDVRRAVQVMALPGPACGADFFRLHRTDPEFDALLPNPFVLRMAEPDQRAADEAAGLLAQGAQQAGDQVGLDHHVVVDEDRIGCTCLFEQEMTLLGHAATRQVAVQFDFATARRQQPQHGGQLAGRPRRTGFSLVRNDEAQSPVGLREQ